MLQFLPVDEVMKMQTRAVSHFFADSKTWVDYLINLMDLDALPVEFPTASLEWEKYFYASVCDQVETVTEMRREGSEGFQGYRIWFKGLYTWHRLCPEIALRSVELMMQHYGSEVCGLPDCFFWSLRASGVRQLRLPMIKGLLPVLCAKRLES